MGRLSDVVKSLSSQAPEPKYIGYNPGPGIYSRLERAVEAMPANVRVEELPGLLKRYKEGVPGWELKEADFPGLIGDAQAIPRQDLLDRVRERSPVFTHREIVLGGNPPKKTHWVENSAGGQSPVYEMAWQSEPSRLGLGISHGNPLYGAVSQGGDQYTELLLLQPGAGAMPWKHHWNKLGEGPFGRQVRQAANDAVAHARFDYHNDALRLNEVQSDLAIHNRKVREENNAGTFAWDPDYLDDLDRRGIAYTLRDDGSLLVHGDPDLTDKGNWQPTIPFPMEDSYLDYLLARVGLEWARSGKPAIELASPQAISRGVAGKRGTNMDIDKLDHLMHKMVAPRLERMGRRMGGMVDDTRLPQKALDDLQRQYASLVDREGDNWRSMADAAIDAHIPPGRSGRASYQLGPTLNGVERGLLVNDTDAMRDWAQRMFRNVAREHMGPDADWLSAADRAAVDAWPHLERTVEANRAYSAAKAQIQGAPSANVSRRYLPSDEMRKRILTSGIGASLLAPMAMEGEE